MDNTGQTNQETTTKQKTEVLRIDGVSPQVNLSPGSETHRRFAKIKTENGIVTNREVVEMLMSAYETPHTDNSDTIANLELELEDLKSENSAYDATCKNYEAEIADLKKQLEAANKMANENAVNGLGKQAQIEELQKQIDGAIIVKPNPVIAYFLKEMAEKTGKSPAKILEKLFSDDLQQPRANNLPYTVEGWRIREVMEELKKQQS